MWVQVVVVLAFFGGGGGGGEGGSVVKGVGAEEVQIYFEGKLNANFKITFYVD